MKTRNIILFLLILLLLPFALKVKGQDFGKSTSLFSDIKAHKVGDIVTVLIYEQSQATQQVETKTEKTSKTKAGGGPGIGPFFRLFPEFNIEGESKNSHDGKGQNLRNGTLRGKITCTVTKVKDNGDLMIEGTRVIGISGDRETITLTGVIRSRDVSADNSIDSYLVGDAQIHYTGKGNATNGSRPGFLSRLFGWLF